jgi:class 3 adenylate cyclase
MSSTARSGNASTGFKRGLLSLNFKFTAITGFVLTALLVLVTLMVNDQLKRDLGREVAERANTVAANLALKAGDPLLSGDELTLAQLMKGSLEKDMPGPVQDQSFVQRALQDLSQDRGQGIKNEGITRVILERFAGANTPRTFFDLDASGAPMGVKTDLELPASQPDALGQEPYPITFMFGRAFYEIQQPVAVAGKTFGTLHLYLRKDVITDAVRAATTRMVVVMLVSLLLGLLCLWVVVRLLLNPIKPLVRGVNAVAQGDFGVQVKIKRGDELGDLVKAYNGMANSLREKEAVQEALAKYTSKDLVNQMLSDKAQLELGGQRVHATILFSVVRGMHALSSSMEAEEYVALINEYLEVETEAIMRNGGSIDKFIGDEVMAVWGLSGPDTPENRVKAAEQAVRAGVEVQAAIERLNADRVKRGEQPFLVSIGINNGEVVSGNMGSSVKMDYTVLGGNVNLAARLGLVAAQGGQTIISHSVFELVGPKFKVDRLAPMQLKGIKEPVPLYWPRKAQS